MLGHQLTYLEAGSGSPEPIALDLIQRVRPLIDHPLMVGGGIRSLKHIESCWDAGANVVVIGNWLEVHQDSASSLTSPMTKPLSGKI